MMDLNDDGPAENWPALLEVHHARLTDAQEHKRHCIAKARGFWERRE